MYDELFNPYFNRTVIDDEEYFFGRRNELRQIYSRLLRGGGSVSLVGERRVGKSSLLSALRFPRERRWLGVPESLRIVGIDCQYLTDGTEEDVLEILLDEMEEELDVEIGPPKTSSLRAVAKQIRGRGEQLVVTLDEFDTLLNNDRISLHFYAFLRAWASEFRICFAAASKEGEIAGMVESSETGSAFLNIFDTVYVGPFKRSEAEELVHVPFEREGGELTEEEAERLFQLAGFHPYFLNLACFHLFDLKISGCPDAEVFPALEQRFCSEARPHMEYQLRHLSRDEIEALRHYALGGDLHTGPTRSKLMMKGILIDDGDEEGPRPFSSLLIETLQSTFADSGSGRFAKGVHAFLFE